MSHMIDKHEYIFPSQKSKVVEIKKYKYCVIIEVHRPCVHRTAKYVSFIRLCCLFPRSHCFD